MLKGEVKVLIEAPALVAVLERLVGVMEKGQTVDIMQGAEKEVAQTTQRKPYQRLPKKQEDKKEDSIQITDEDIPSVVDLRAVAQEKGKTAEGKKAIKALLEAYESKSISTIPEEKRAAFMSDLEAL